uniref:Echinoderm microtubule-associated protein-like CG42247-like n=1 Tax=Saccoglossus kowalevskii TaxID=10224 RepID=A0ABM0M520_SACKO|nr:PREDICTED: echinoderm microtubule-associated protein-like CG42247-like [Saccoglossus kowalevskii]
MDRYMSDRERRAAILARAEELLRTNRHPEQEGDVDDQGGEYSSQDGDYDEEPSQWESFDTSAFNLMSPTMDVMAHHNGQPLHKESKGKLITFYRNGDRHFKGLTIPVNHRNFSTWETLLVYLSEKITLPYGVRHIYTLNGRMLGDISELEAGKGYVCAGGQFVSQIPYGKSSERYWHNRKPTGGIRKTDRPLFKPAGMTGVPNLSPQPLSRLSNESPTMRHKPRIITVLSNTHRDSKAKILLNPKTTQSFEQVLRDMTQALTMRSPPIQALYTWKTEERVESFSQLFRDFRDYDTFVACGAEDLLRTPPANNVYSSLDGAPSRRQDGVKGSHLVAQQKRKPKKKRRQEPPHAYTEHPKPQQMQLQHPPQIQLQPHHHQQQQQHPPPHQQHYHPQPVQQNSYSPVTDASSELESIPVTGRQGFASSSEGSLTGHPKPYTFRGNPQQESMHTQTFPFKKYAPKDNYDELRYDARRARQERYLHKAIQASNDNNHLPQIVDNRETERDMKMRYQQNKATQANGIAFLDNERDNSLDPVKIKVHGQMRQFYPPSNINTRYPDPNTKPDRKLKLQWVYGYRGYDARCNLYVIPSGEVVYFVGAIAILYDTDLQFQRHYLGHNEDIQCMAVHPSENYIATGQMAGQLPDSTAHIRIWETETLCTHAIIGLDVFQTGVVSINFSKENGGDWLLALDEGDNHVLSVWDWQQDKLIANTKTHPDTVVFAVFHPNDDNCIITGGKQHLYFWRVMSSKILRDKKSGVFEEDKPKYVTCIEFAQNGDVITGDSNGSLTIWSKDAANVYRSKQRIPHAHEKSVFTLCMLLDGTLLSGGGVDRKIVAWDSLRAYSSVRAERLPEAAGGIRTITARNTGSADGILLLGTTRNNIVEGSLQMKFSYLVQGHCEEIWALATHPRQTSFVTAGYDMSVILWAAETHKLIWRTQIEKSCLSCAFNPSGSVIALATTAGRFIILNAATGTHITSVQVGNEQLDAIKYSPDGNILAMGSHDNNIYLFSVLDDGNVYRKIGVLQGHENFITHLDWSDDGYYLQSVSGNYDLLYWDVNSMKREKVAMVMRDAAWKTQSCILGYDVLGVWASKEVGTDVNVVERSPHQDILVAGDNHGFLSVFRYPCTSPKAESHDCKAYSSHVTNLRFLQDDKFMISTGGLDACVMQWVLVDKNGRYFSTGGNEL